MKVTRHDDDGSQILFPALLVHEHTNCVGLFNSTETYTVIDKGNQSKGVGTISNQADITMWKIFRGFINLKND